MLVSVNSCQSCCGNAFILVIFNFGVMLRDKIVLVLIVIHCNSFPLFFQVRSPVLSLDSCYNASSQYHSLLCKKGTHILFASSQLFVLIPPRPSIQVQCLLFRVFFLPQVDLFKNCRPESRPYKTSKSTSLFMKVLLLSFMLAVVPAGYIVGK